MDRCGRVGQGWGVWDRGGEGGWEHVGGGRGWQLPKATQSPQHCKHVPKCPIVLAVEFCNHSRRATAAGCRNPSMTSDCPPYAVAAAPHLSKGFWGTQRNAACRPRFFFPPPPTEIDIEVDVHVHALPLPRRLAPNMPTHPLPEHPLPECSPLEEMRPKSEGWRLVQFLTAPEFSGTTSSQDSIEIGALIGRGSFGSVRAVQHPHSIDTFLLAYFDWQRGLVYKRW